MPLSTMVRALAGRARTASMCLASTPAAMLRAAMSGAVMTGALRAGSPARAIGMALALAAAWPAHAAPLPVLSIDDVTVVEGDEGYSEAVFTIALDRPAPIGGVTFYPSIVPGTAGLGQDFYLPQQPRPRIEPFAMRYRLVVAIIGERRLEADETFEIELLSIDGAQPGRTRGTGTIRNDDGVPVLSIRGTTVAEGRTGGVWIESDAPAPAGGITFGYRVRAGSATQGQDYTVSIGYNQRLPPGTTRAALLVDALPDALEEGEETFSIELVDVTGARVGNGIADVVINDAPASLPTLDIDDAAPIMEGDSGVRDMVFPLRLSAPSPHRVVAGYYAPVVDHLDEQHDSVYREVTIEPGQTTAEIRVPVHGDRRPESDRRYRISLMRVMNAVSGRHIADGMLHDDDTISIDVITYTAIVGVPYYDTEISVEGGGVPPYSLAVSHGAVPPGLSIEDPGFEDGRYRVGGTPTQAGVYPFTVSITDSGTGPAGPTTVSRDIVMVVTADALTLPEATLPDATAQAPYTAALPRATGGAGPYAYRMYAIHGYASPDGLTLAEDGTLSGAPRAAGAFRFAVRVDDASPHPGAAPGYQVYTLDVRAPALVLTPAQPVAAVVGHAYAQPLQATGGQAPYAFSLLDGALPAGLTLDAAGLLAGTPTQAGTFEAVVRVADSAAPTPARADIALRLTVAPPPMRIAVDDDAALIERGVPHARRFTASGGVGPYRYEIRRSTLPAEFAFDDGTLSGTPQQAGMYTYVIAVSDLGTTGAGAPVTMEWAFQLRVRGAPIEMAPAQVPAAELQRPYALQFTCDGGIAPYRFELDASGVAPDGLAMGEDGALTGTPQRVGEVPLRVRCTDAAGDIGQREYRLLTRSPALALLTDALPPGAVGVAYAQAWQVSGGTAPYHLEVIDGTPPPGLAVDRTGALAGVPGTTGSFGFVLRVRDSAAGTPATVERAFTLAIVDAGAPVAMDDAASAVAGVPAALTVTDNDRGAFTAIAIATAPAHGTAVIDGLAVRYLAAPGFTGTDTYRYALEGPGGRSVATVTVAVLARAAAVSRTLDALAGVPLQVDLGEGASGGPFTGATLVSLAPAAAGSARIVTTGAGVAARHALTYTPAADYAGVATIAFTLDGADGGPAAATLTVRVAPRPDPARDADVRGLLEAQVQATRRFGDTQRRNVQQRLERLHGDAAPRGFSNGLGASVRVDCPRQVGQMPGRGCAPPVDTTVAAASAGSAPGEAAFDVWTAGTLRSGQHDRRDAGARVAFETDGVSLGADVRLDAAWAVGGGLGYGRDDSRIGEHGSRSAGDAFTLMLYASHRPGGRAFVDALLGHQWLDFALHRQVAAGDGVVRGRRHGTQWFGAVSVGADLPHGAWQFTPYARVDVARADLRAYAESGDTGFALAYDALALDSVTGNAGLRIDYRRALGRGVLSPQLRLEYQHEVSGSGAQAMRHADTPAGPGFRAGMGGFDRRRVLLGLGLSYAIDADWSATLDYRGLLGSGQDRDHGFTLAIDRRF